MEHVILVVDDDKNNLMLAQKIFGKNYRIAAATSGMAAFKYLEKKEQYYSVIVATDYIAAYTIH